MKLIGKTMIKKVKKIANFLGLEVIRDETYRRLINDSDELTLAKIKLYLYKNSGNRELLTEWLNLSTAQILQDVVVADYFDYKQSGFFVEFGGADGKYLSNTYLLEKRLGWNGIVAEPAKGWHSALQMNRSCNISNKVVSGVSGQMINFEEDQDLTLSSVSKNTDQVGVGNYQVESISLKDLLGQFHAPKTIDFLSIDVEGHELEVLKEFKELPYRFKFIICEHTAVNPDTLKVVMSDAGYQTLEEGLGRQDFWFIPKF